MKPFKKILAPIDFSPPSELAIQAAADLAKRYDATLAIVHVYEPVVYSLPEGYMLLTEPQLEQLLGALREHLEAAKQGATATGAPRVETHLLQGFAAGEICAFAERGDFDLIVMGTHGRKGLSHVVLGSVAERVVRSAPCPVLTIRAPRAPKH